MSNFIAEVPIQTPFTDLSVLFLPTDCQAHRNELCRRFEMNYLSCLEAYGLEKGRAVCQDYKDDLYECRFGYKQDQRYKRIQEERKKQFKQGVIEKRYSDTPPLTGVDFHQV